MCCGSQILAAVAGTLSPCPRSTTRSSFLPIRDGNEFCGVVELNQPMEENSDQRDIEAILARNFDLQQSAVRLISWSRLH